MRAVVSTVLVLLLVFVVFALLRGTPWQRYSAHPEPAAVGTGGQTGTVDRARDAGARVGEKVGEAAVKVRETADEAAITTKIKAKMALDDNVRARAIDVTTTGTTVTLSGTVQSQDEHDRAVRLARETKGVTDVVDQLRIGS